MSFNCAAVIAALFVILGFQSGLAQDVTLTSRDGSVEITGNLLGFDGEFYRVDTVYGELTVDGSGVLCGGPGCPNLQEFVAHLSISGSATMGQVLVPALVEAFAQRNGYRARRERLGQEHFEYVLSDVARDKIVGRFEFRNGSTDDGFVDLLANDVDLVMALREIRPDELALAKEAGLGDMTAASRSRVLALDGMVAIVAPGNPVQAISMSDLAATFAGTITNWSELGGADAPISLYLPEAKSGLSQAVEDRLLRPIRAKVLSGVLRYSNNKTLAQAVVNDPFSLGIASYAETGIADVLTLTGTCGFSVYASRQSIKTEDYPLTSPMFFYQPARRMPKLARDFLAYTRGPDAQIVIRRAGFVDQASEEISISAQGERFANAISVAGKDVGIEQSQRMIRVLSPFARLTTSFRFEAGSVRLDAQSRSNIEHLAAAIEAGAYDSRRILFAGFSDGIGPSASNEAIARRRAEEVRRAVVAAAKTANLDRLSLEIDAFGEVMPMACDDSEWGRHVNRRVEIWVR